jgi:hypothetical protein
MAHRVRLDKLTEVVAANAANSFPAPAAAGDGVSISVAETNISIPKNAGEWHLPGGGHFDAVVFIETSQAQTFSGALGLYGFRTDTAKWYLIGTLNNGTAIVTLANSGFAQAVEAVGLFDRLLVGSLSAVAVTPGAGTATIRIAQAIEDRR